MALSVDVVPVPLHTNSDGVALIGQTRVTLDTVIAAFDEGAAAEEIVLQYPALTLGQVYSVIGYYLEHQEAVHTYLKERQANAKRVRKLNEASHRPHGIRGRLLARRS